MTCGTDFYSDPKLLAHEYEEVFALQRYGVPKEAAWAAFLWADPYKKGDRCVPSFNNPIKQPSV